MGVAADFPAAFAKAQAAAGARLPRGRHGVPHGDRLRQGRRWSGIAAQLHDLGFRIVATRGTAAAISRMGIPVERLNKIQEGSPHVRRLDRPRRRRPRDQHADRHRGALGRLRDPPRRGRPRHPVHHDDRRRDGRRARRSPPAALRRAAGASRCRSCTRNGARERARGRDVSRPHARAARAAGCAAGRRRDRRASAPTTCSPCADPTARRPTRASSTCSPPPSGGAGARTSARSCRARSRVLRAPRRTARSSSCSRTSGPGTRAARRAARRATGCGCSGPLGSGFAPPRDGRRPLLVGGGVGIAPLAIWQRRARRARWSLLGFRDAAHAEGAALMRGARVATDDGSVGPPRARDRPAARASSAATRDAEVYACGPPPMLEAVRAHLRRARRPRPARAGVRHGVRVRRLLRLRRARRTDGYVRLCVDGPVLDADDARGVVGRDRLLRHPLAHPVINALGDVRRDRRPARVRRRAARALPVRRVRHQDRHARAAPGQPAAAAVGAAGAGCSTRSGCPTRASRATSRRTCRSSPSCPCR